MLLIARRPRRVLRCSRSRPARAVTDAHSPALAVRVDRRLSRDRHASRSACGSATSRSPSAARAIDRRKKVGQYPSQCAVGDQIFYNAEANTLAPATASSSWGHPGSSRRPRPITRRSPSSCSRGVNWRRALAALACCTTRPNVREDRYAMAVLGTFLVFLIGLLGRRVGRRPGVGLGRGAASPRSPEHLGQRRADHVGDPHRHRGRAGVARSRSRCGTDREPRAAARARRGVRDGHARARRARCCSSRCSVSSCSRRARGRPANAFAVVVVIARRSWSVARGSATTSRFKDPTFVSTNDGIALAGSYCDNVYSGSGDRAHVISGRRASTIRQPPGDQSQVSAVYRKRRSTTCARTEPGAARGRGRASAARGACTGRSTCSCSTRRGPGAVGHRGRSDRVLPARRSRSPEWWILCAAGEGCCGRWSCPRSR